MVLKSKTLPRKNKEDEKKYKEYLMAIRDYAEEQYDKLMVYISSGALVLTVGFVDKIVDFKHGVNHLSWLFSSWVFFVLALIFILLSYDISDI